MQAGGGHRLLAGRHQQGAAPRRGLAAMALAIDRFTGGTVPASALRPDLMGAAAGRAAASRARTPSETLHGIARHDGPPAHSNRACPSRRSLPGAATDRRGSRPLRVGEPRRLLLALAAVSAAGGRNNRWTKRGDAMAHDAQDRKTWNAARVPALGLTRFAWGPESVALLRQRWAGGSARAALRRNWAPGRLALRGARQGASAQIEAAGVQAEPSAKERVRPRPPVRIQACRHPGAERAHGRIPGARPRRALWRAGPPSDFLSRKPGRVRGGEQAGRSGPDAAARARRATCRWPVGEPGEAAFVFCGAAPFSAIRIAWAIASSRLAPTAASAATASRCARPRLRAAIRASSAPRKSVQ